MEKFNYQLVFNVSSIDSNDRIIFTGITELKPNEIISFCKGLINIENFDLDSAIENIVYQPVNLDKKGDPK